VIHIVQAAQHALQATPLRGLVSRLDLVMWGVLKREGQRESRGAAYANRWGATRSCASSCCGRRIIRTHGDTTRHNPVVCNRYSIQACVIGKTAPSGTPMGCEALETKVSRVQLDGNGTARRRCDCQHQAVRGQSRVVWLTYVNR
jgi:hypothetical protein